MSKNGLLLKIDWPNHLIEIIVVIAGILIAFQLNKCSQNRKEAKTIDKHLASVCEETEKNEYFLDLAIAKLDSNLLRVKRVVESTQSGDDSTSEVMALLDVGGSYFNKNAFNTLAQTGDIRLIKDYDTKDKIINLYEFYKYVKGHDDVHLNFFQQDFFPFVLNNLDMSQRGETDLSIFRSRKFRNIMGTFNHMLNSRKEKYLECKKQIQETQSYLNCKKKK